MSANNVVVVDNKGMRFNEQAKRDALTRSMSIFEQTSAKFCSQTWSETPLSSRFENVDAFLKQWEMLFEDFNSFVMKRILGGFVFDEAVWIQIRSSLKEHAELEGLEQLRETYKSIVELRENIRGGLDASDVGIPLNEEQENDEIANLSDDIDSVVDGFANQPARQEVRRSTRSRVSSVNVPVIHPSKEVGPRRASAVETTRASRSSSSRASTVHQSELFKHCGRLMAKTVRQVVVDFFKEERQRAEMRKEREDERGSVRSHRSASSRAHSTMITPRVSDSNGQSASNPRHQSVSRDLFVEPSRTIKKVSRNPCDRFNLGSHLDSSSDEDEVFVINNQQKRKNRVGEQQVRFTSDSEVGEAKPVRDVRHSVYRRNFIKPRIEIVTFTGTDGKYFEAMDALDAILDGNLNESEKLLYLRQACKGEAHSVIASFKAKVPGDYARARKRLEFKYGDKLKRIDVLFRELLNLKEKDSFTVAEISKRCSDIERIMEEMKELGANVNEASYISTFLNKMPRKISKHLRRAGRFTSARKLMAAMERVMLSLEEETNLKASRVDIDVNATVVSNQSKPVPDSDEDSSD